MSQKTLAIGFNATQETIYYRDNKVIARLFVARGKYLTELRPKFGRFAAND